MKRKKKKPKKIRSLKSKRTKLKKSNKKNKKIAKRKSKTKKSIKSKSRKIKFKKNKIKFRRSERNKQKKTRAVISSLLSLSDKVKSMLRFNLNLDQSLQNFFQGISNRVSNIKKVIQEERSKQKEKKIKEMEREKILARKRFMQQEEIALKAKALELKEEKELSRQLSIDLKRFLREDQAELRRERAEKQRKFLEQIKLEKKIESFVRREEKEVQALSKYVLSQQRESYEEVKLRIDKIKEKYKALRQQKVEEAIRERLTQFGVEVKDSDTKEILLEKERVYNEEREKVEYALESFYRASHSLCFMISKRYLSKHLPIMRCIDKRIEESSIYIKWDDTPENEWLICIYLKDNSPTQGIVIEDKTDPEKNISKEFKRDQIFDASDFMVDSLTALLDRERNKRKAS
ncbi:hypothetical protein N9U33_00755 [Candidatus Pelagibacter bacterium]|nr:hypothetical protein [Candidatus Pelagibacter bacterium]